MRNSGSGVNFATRRRELAGCRVTWLVVLIIVAVQGLVEIAGGTAGLQQVGTGSGGIRWTYETFGLDRAGVADWKVWKLLTYAFFHGGWVHVGVNATCILLLGSRLEATVGSQVVLRTIIGGVLAGAVVHLALGIGNESDAPLLVGISGGAVSLLLLLTTLSPESRMWPLPVSGRSLGVGILIAELLLTLLNPALAIPGLSFAGQIAREVFGDLFVIGHACHLGGGVCGWAIGRWILRPRPNLGRLQRERHRREVENR